MSTLRNANVAAPCRAQRVQIRRNFATKKKSIGASNTSTGKSAALEAAMKQIEQQYGRGTVMTLGSRSAELWGAGSELDAVSTGSIALDGALGIGGVPRGRVVEIYGPEASGKTTLALHVLAEAQKAARLKGEKATCAFIDAEHALDASYARRIGVNTDELLISQPDHGEQALEICETLVRSGAVDIVVVDSVAALVPRAELEGDMGDAHMALQARLMSQALRKLTAVLSKTNSLLIFINQIRHKVGVMFGSPEVTAGGNALKFYASVRMDIRRVSPIKSPKGDELIGNHVRVKVVKNKLAPPFAQVEFDLMYGKGISKTGELVDLGARLGVLSKAGAWYAYGDVQLGQGREKTKLYLQENKAVADEIEQKIRAQLQHPHLDMPPDNAIDDEDVSLESALESDAFESNADEESKA